MKMLKNLKVGTKLIFTVAVALVLFAVTIVISVVNMDSTSVELETFYNSPYHVRSMSRELDTSIQGLVASVYRYSMADDEKIRKEAMGEIEHNLTVGHECITEIQKRFLGDKQIVESLANELDELKYDREKILEMARAGTDKAQMSRYMETNNLVHVAAIRGYIKQIIDFANNKGEQMLTTIREHQNDTKVQMITIGIAGIILSLILALIIAGSITQPLTRIQTIMNRTGNTGDIYPTEQEQQKIEKDIESKDEIGQTIFAFMRLSGHVTNMAEALKKVAEKDFSDNVMTLSERDVLGNSIIQMQSSINRVFSEMQMAIAQISVGSGQIADGAQSLAQGVTEQSSVIEELSASMLQISRQTDNNVTLAMRVKEMGTAISENAKEGSQQVQLLLQAMNEIDSANKAISKIIGLIEDISFQTNILSLNAAIEAARAGEHGKGFAVIVTAVRELAAKSAEAADTINQLIQSSTEKSNSGSIISMQTAKAIDDIMERTMGNAELVAQIAQASSEQAAAISQVVIGIEQVAEVVHRNSTTAEQSAAASEEVSRQANQLREFIGQFKIKGHA